MTSKRRIAAAALTVLWCFASLGAGSQKVLPGEPDPSPSVQARPRRTVLAWQHQPLPPQARPTRISRARRRPPVAVKPVPRPKPKPRVRVKAVKTKPRVRIRKRVNVVNSGRLPAILIAIRKCESGHNYRAQNPVSTASGAFQFIRGTWDGYGGYSEAYLAPRAVQDAKALSTYRKSGTKPWTASRRCWS